MKFVPCATTFLAGVLVLGLMQVSVATAATEATPMLSIAVGDYVSVFESIGSTGSFSDWVDFSVNDDASIISTSNSLTWTNAGKANGVVINAVNLYDGDHAVLLASGSVTSPFPGIYTSSLSYGAIKALHAYAINIVGQAFSANSSYSLILSTAAVPEPEGYAMFLAGLGILGGMVYRRSRWMHHSN